MIGKITKNVIGAASNDNTRSFLRQFLDKLSLESKNLIWKNHMTLVRHVIAGTIFIGERGGNGVKETHGLIFSFFLHSFLCQSTTFSYHLYNFFIVERDIQTLRYLFSNGVTAASALTADGNDFTAHYIPSLKIRFH